MLRHGRVDRLALFLECQPAAYLNLMRLVRIWAGSGVTDADVRRWKEAPPMPLPLRGCRRANSKQTCQVATISHEVQTQAGHALDNLDIMSRCSSSC